MLYAFQFFILFTLIFQSGIALAEMGHAAKPLLQGPAMSAPKAEFCDQSTYSDMKGWTQKQVGSYTKCLQAKDKTLTKKSQVSLANAMSFEVACDLKREQSLSFSHDLNNALEQSFWADIAQKSHEQASCRTKFFDEYLDKPAQEDKLNKKVETSFNEYKGRLAELGEFRRKIKDAKDEYDRTIVVAQGDVAGAGPDVTNLYSCKEVLKETKYKTCQEANDAIDKEIAGIMTKIPMGHEPEVGARLMIMAMNDNFDAKSFRDGMIESQIKYDKSVKYYCEKFSAGCPKKGESPRRGNYCLDLDYKNFAAQSGQTDILIKSHNVLSEKDKAILQCKVNSVYKDGAKKVDAGLAIAFIAGGIVTMAPSGGTSLAAIGIGVSSLGFIDQLDRVRNKCAMNTYIISGEQKKCNPEQDFNKEIETSSMGSCIAQSGLLALGAVAIPLSVKNLVNVRRAAKLAQVEKEAAAASKADDVASEADTIVVTGQKPKVKPVAAKKRKIPCISSVSPSLINLVLPYAFAEAPCPEPVAAKPGAVSRFFSKFKKEDSLATAQWTDETRAAALQRYRETGEEVKVSAKGTSPETALAKETDASDFFGFGESSVHDTVMSGSMSGMGRYNFVTKEGRKVSQREFWWSDVEVPPSSSLSPTTKPLIKEFGEANVKRTLGWPKEKASNFGDKVSLDSHRFALTEAFETLPNGQKVIKKASLEVISKDKKGNWQPFLYEWDKGRWTQVRTFQGQPVRDACMKCHSSGGKFTPLPHAVVKDSSGLSRIYESPYSQRTFERLQGGGHP